MDLRSRAAVYLLGPYLALLGACGGLPMAPIATPPTETITGANIVSPNTGSQSEIKQVPSLKPVSLGTDTPPVVTAGGPWSSEPSRSVPTSTSAAPQTHQPQPNLTPKPPATPIPDPRLTISPTTRQTNTPPDVTSTRSDLTGQTVHLMADGRTDTYALIAGALGGNPIEHGDCAHPEFGPHITQEWDDILGKHIFVFHIHVTPDNDRCLKFDRQRNEIKAYGKSPSYLKGFWGETVTYRWRFKLDEGFQPSKNFTHIHQLKGVGGNDSKPVIALTPRISDPNVLEIGYGDSTGNKTIVASSPLSLFKGAWVEVYEKVTYGYQSNLRPSGFTGSYWIELRDLMSGDLLLSYEDAKLDLWRPGFEFVRPKWGIYRSLNSKEYLRDEQVRFDQFCLGKGSDDCL